MQKVIIIISVSLLLCLICSLGILHWMIQSDLNEIAEKAQSAHSHPGDNIGALIEVAQTESHTLKERNRAVWALRQARDCWGPARWSANRN
jgi:flagellar basal body-associated protein FliL